MWMHDLCDLYSAVKIGVYQTLDNVIFFVAHVCSCHAFRGLAFVYNLSYSERVRIKLTNEINFKRL